MAAETGFSHTTMPFDRRRPIFAPHFATGAQHKPVAQLFAIEREIARREAIKERKRRKERR
jgi:hypothetical protein